MNSKKIIDTVVGLYHEAIPEDDVRANARIDQVFQSVKIDATIGLSDFYIAYIHANGVIGSKYDPYGKTRAKIYDYLSTEFDKTYLLSFSDNSPSYADRNKVRNQILFPAVEVNMKEVGHSAAEIKKALRTFKIDDWFFDFANFILLSALTHSNWYQSEREFRMAITKFISQQFFGLIPTELTNEYFEHVRKAVIEKVINKNLK